MYIGICDDEKIIRGMIREYIDSYGAGDTVYHFKDAEDVCGHISRGRPLDILFLDIDLGAGPDGMSLAGRIKKNQIAEGSGGDRLPLIIFISGYPERMPEAFGVRAFEYIVKPIDRKRFGNVLESARKSVIYAKSGHTGKTITINSGSVTSTLKLSDIYYVESYGRKLVFHSAGGIREAYGKISGIGSELGDDFYPTHRSYVVNLSKVADYGKGAVKIDKGEEIPLSRYKRDDFVRAYAAFLGKTAL